MAQTPGDERSRRWLDKFDVDIGACRVFLGLKPEQQEAIRRMGGLGRSHQSGVLMRRIRGSFGFVDLPTLMASDDLDQLSRSPAHGVPSTQMHEEGSGKGCLGDVISGPQQCNASDSAAQPDSPSSSSSARRPAVNAAEDTKSGLSAEAYGLLVSIWNKIARDDDLDQRSRSPALRISRTQMNEKGSGKGNLGQIQVYSGDVTARPQQLPLGVEHFKGSGKGSLGDTIPHPEPVNVSRAEQPVASEPVDNRGNTAGKKMSPQEIDVWIRDNYKEVGNAWEGNILDLSTGMSVLWKGIKKGKSGGESTTYEYFNGKFHGWDDDAFVIVS